MKPIEKILENLHGVIGRGPQYSAKCPSHEDNGPSLRVKELEDGRVLINCRAGCSTADVMNAIGLSLADLYSQPKKHAIQPLLINQQLINKRDRDIGILKGLNSRLRDENHAMALENSAYRKKFGNIKVEKMKQESSCIGIVHEGKIIPAEDMKNFYDMVKPQTGKHHA